MKFTMSTAKMNSILGKLAKGVGSSKILPITEYLKLELVEGKLTIVATDASNFIKHVEEGVEGLDGTAIVKADKLIKLVSKTTKAQIEFDLKPTHLEVKGNGTYKVELFETNEYPEYEFDMSITGVTVKTASLKKAFAINKSSIATEMLMPCLTGYNVGGTVVTTDGVKMCLNETSILPENALITQKLADLLQVINGEDITIRKDGNKLLFVADNTTVFGTELEGLEEYPDISGVTGLEFANYAILKRQQVVDALDRLSLFVDNTTNFGVQIRFQADAVYIEDLKQKSTEVIEYVEKSQSDENVTMMFNLQYLEDILAALTKENMTVHYSEALPLKLVEEHVTLVLSTMAPEEQQ